MKNMKKGNTKIELNRWISANSKFSRRKATELINNRKVSVNSKTVDKPFVKIDPIKDKVKINGQKVILEESKKLQYLMINKPKGFVSSTKSDSSGSPPVTKLMPNSSGLYPAGRLDINSQGLIILTNDGNLTYKLTHPKSSIQKEYHVHVNGSVTHKKLNNLSSGVVLREGKTKMAKIEILSQDGKGTWMSITITQGKNRQIRRIFASVDLHVDVLIRVRIGSLSLGNLKLGESKQLSSKQVELLIE